MSFVAFIVAMITPVTLFLGPVEKPLEDTTDVVVAAVDTPAPVGYTPPHGWEVWDRLAQCESNGNWSINTGNSFYGGLQFNKLSWDWAGGQRYAEYPHQATRVQQIEIAEELLSIHPAGWAAWPACTKKLWIRK